jgi:hypothetical protein
MAPVPFVDFPRIDPDGEWAGMDAFIIGGGASLKGFNFDLLAGRNVIGVNDAFRIGPHIVKICIFGDATWFQKNKWDLELFTGKVVSVASSLQSMQLPWLLKLGRAADRMGDGNYLAWHYSTGAAAISLAVHLKASRIYLLGFDMALVASKSHWHSHRAQVTSEVAFQRHLRGMRDMAQSLFHSPVKVFNVTDESRLDCFPRIPVQDFLSTLT